VLTGIGHETDRAVADEVAHRSEKTPTACAQALVGLVAAFDDLLDGAWAAIAHRALRDIDGHQARLDDAARRAGRGATAGLQTAVRRLDGHRGRVAGAARAHVRAADLVLVDGARRLRARAPRSLADADRSLASLEARVRANDPERTLARGWSITRTASGEVVRSPDDVAPGDELRTLVAGGEVRSTVVGDA
jgi:exodeoxyribonuclease VII large subunit